MLDLQSDDSVDASASLPHWEDYLYQDFKTRAARVNEDLPPSLDATTGMPLEELVRRYREGNDASFVELYNFYERKINNLAKRYNDDDLVPELYEVLFRAVRKYNPAHSTKFNTYFWCCAQNHMGSKRHKQRLLKHGAKGTEQEQRVVSLNANYLGGEADDDSSVAAYITDPTAARPFQSQLFNTALEQILSTNTLRPKEVMAIRLICEEPSLTLEQLGAKLGNISAPAVHTILRRVATRPCAPLLREALR